MTLLEFPISAGIWLAPLTALAVAATTAAVILLRDHLRLERHSADLEDQVARLEGEIRNRVEANDRESKSVSHSGADVAQASALRAPLGGIVGLATLLLNTELNGEQAIHVRRIKAVAEDLIGTITPSADNATEAARLSRQGPRRPMRVLLAEDNEINGLFARQSLELAGVVVDRASDGLEALKSVEASFSGAAPAYDAVLMDIRMPGVDGLEATRRIRSLEADLKRPDRLRIVAVTASTMRQDRQAAEAAGFDAFLAKPYRADTLVNLLAAPGERLAHAS